MAVSNTVGQGVPGTVAASKLIKGACTSPTTAVAGAIAGVIREQYCAEIQAVGAGAVNQVVKALATTRGFLDGDGLAITCTIHFMDVNIDGNERTAIRFKVAVL
ncbi:MAG: stage V sporulation protein S [Anaerolineae bacterium]|nr:stage V sporulation protein S [Anaerolineae bacterium]